MLCLCALILPGCEESQTDYGIMLLIIMIPLSFSTLKPNSRGGIREFRSVTALARLSHRNSKPSHHTIPVESKDPKTNLGTNNLLVQTGSTHSGAQMKIKPPERSKRLAVTPEGSMPTSGHIRTGDSRVTGSQLCRQIFPAFPAQEREVPCMRCVSQHTC